MHLTFFPVLLTAWCACHVTHQYILHMFHTICIQCMETACIELTEIIFQYLHGNVDIEALKLNYVNLVLLTMISSVHALFEQSAVMKYSKSGSRAMELPIWIKSKVYI